VGLPANPGLFSARTPEASFASGATLGCVADLIDALDHLTTSTIPNPCAFFAPKTCIVTEDQEAQLREIYLGLAVVLLSPVPLKSRIF